MFVIDTYKAFFKSPKGNYSFKNCTAGSLNISGESIEINAGWDFQKLAKIKTSQNIEVSLTNAEFDSQLMSLAIGSELNKNATTSFYHLGENFSVATDVITIPKNVVSGSVSINGYTEVTSAPANEKEFKVASTSGSTTITFKTGSVPNGTVLSVVYAESISTSEEFSLKDKNFSTIGELILQQPLYANDSADSDIVGYLQITIYKCLLEAEVSLSGERKSHNTYDVKLTGMSSGRPDNKNISFSVIPTPKA